MQMFTQREAAEACAVSVETVKRRRVAGAFPNAEQDDRGVWSIPLADLLAAGLNPGRPAPPDVPPQKSSDEVVIDLREQLAELRARLAERDRAEERSRELVQQALDAVKGQVKAIEAGRVDQARSSDVMRQEMDHLRQRAIEAESAAAQDRRGATRQVVVVLAVVTLLLAAGMLGMALSRS